MSQVVLNTARQVLKIEAQTLQRMIQRLDHRFTKAIDMMFHCKGRIILTGMGKPGFIARKIAATLASTGTPSFYLHPAEATHGDLGMVQETDLVIAISNSGETEEIVRLISALKKIGVPLIALTSNKKSTLALHADVVLELGVTREACPLNLAPSASTTAALAMGDALALSLHQRKGFRSEDFAMLHPGGSLGRQLLTVKDIMRKGRDNPLISENLSVRDALIKITGARAGSCTITDKHGKIRGIFTDGDFRRHVRRNGERILDEPVKKFSTFNPMTIRQDQLAAEAVHLL